MKNQITKKHSTASKHDIWYASSRESFDTEGTPKSHEPLKRVKRSELPDFIPPAMAASGPFFLINFSMTSVLNAPRTPFPFNTKWI